MEQTISRPAYVGFDLETTGVDPFSDLPVSFGFVEHHEGRLITRRGYVNPGIPIPNAVTAIHGITDAMVTDAPNLKTATDRIATDLATIWQRGGVIVGMNVSYDLTMVESLCRLLGLTPLSKRVGIGPVLDVLILDRKVDKWRKGGRKLTDLCAHYGVTLGDAHDASADAAACLEILTIMQSRYPEIASIRTSEINEILRAWYQTWLRDFSGYLEKKGEPAIAAGRYEWPIHAAS